MDSTSNRPSPLSEPVIEALIDFWAQTGREHEVDVRGNSMWPLVRDGDKARIAHGLGKLKRGDVVAYQRNGELVVHRLIRIVHGAGEPRFLIKGDNVSGYDPTVPASRVLGRVVALQRSGKWRRLDTLLMRAIGWTVATITLAKFMLQWLFR